MPELETPDYERKDIETRSTMWFGAGLVVVLMATFVAIRIFLSMLGGSQPLAKAAPPQTDFPAPRLQTDDAADLARLRFAEETRLHAYGWVDREAGIIHLPIERAMELTVQRGLPARSSKKEGEK